MDDFLKITKNGYLISRVELRVLLVTLNPLIPFSIPAPVAQE